MSFSSTKDNIKFSVLLCVNKEIPFLDEAITSILEQDYTDFFEFIIIANNCDDSLYDFLMKYKDERIRLHRTSIGQLSFNLNYGVNLAKGDYIVRMDADDISLKNRLTIANDYLASRSEVIDVVGFSSLLIDEDGNHIGSKILDDKRLSYKDVLFRSPLIHPATIIKKDSIIDMRGYLGGFQSEDYDLWLRMLKRTDIVIYTSNEPVLKYRINSLQSKGNLLPYCEVSSYLLRELMLNFNFSNMLAFLISVLKRYIKH